MESSITDKIKWSEPVTAAELDLENHQDQIAALKLMMQQGYRYSDRMGVYTRVET